MIKRCPHTGLCLLLALAPLWGCSEEHGWRTYCFNDEDCPPGHRCDPDTGLCLCLEDWVCEVGEYCAPDGICRPKMGCDTNRDCPEDMFCDTTTGNCIELGKCTKNEQCPLGEICSQTYFKCITGCVVSGDCPLGEVCREGKCKQGLCDDKSYCAYGQICDSVTETCLDDTRGPYCEKCKPGTVGDPYRCGPGPNFCVMTNNDPSLEPFCGVDCDDGQECPNGYGCHLILIAPGGDCRSDQDCESGECHINEGDEVGFCLCTQDSQCPNDYCDEFTMECAYTRKPCTPNGGECDRPIYCRDGLCLIGRNCTPLEGLDCDDLR